MKRFLISILALCAVTVAFAQNQITLVKDNLCKPRAIPWLVSASLEGSGDQHYTYNADFYNDAAKHYRADAVLCMDKNGGGVSEIRLDCPDDYNFKAFYEGEHDLFGIYSLYDRKSKVYTLYLNTIGKDRNKAAWKPQKLLSVTTEKRDDLYSFVAVSPDGKKAAVSVIQATKKGNMKGSAVILLGEGGEQLWNNSFDPEFPNPTFFITDMIVSNNGEVFIGAVSYANETRKTRDNETIHMYMITDNDVKHADERIDFGYICNGKLMIRKNGEVACGGYFSNYLNEKAKGTYMMVFEGDASNIKNSSSQKFPASYFEDSKISLGMIKGEKMSVEVNDLYEFQDGTMVLLGEQRELTIRTVTNKNGMTTTYYTYHARNILTSFVDENGNLGTFEMIPKYQMAGSFVIPMGLKQLRSYGYSFCSFMHNDKLQIIYADNMDNYLGKTGLVCKSGASGKHCSILRTIEPNEQISDPVMIINPKLSNKTRMTNPLFIDEDGLLFIAAGKKAGQLMRLSYEF